MQRHLLLLAGLVLTGIHPIQAQAPYNFAGQTAGTASVSLTPFVVLTGQAYYSAGGEVSQHEVDLDNDGRPDLRLSASGPAQVRYASHSTGVVVRHSDMQLYTAIESRGPAGVSLASGDTLQPVMHRRTAAGTRGSWSDGSNSYNGVTHYNPFLLSLDAYGALGFYSAGGWLDMQEHYLGFRLRAHAAAPWRYGWLLVQVTSTSFPVRLAIKSYALASQPLGVRSALAAGWHIYPTQVADQLTIEPPLEAGKGELTIFNLCGREVIREQLTGRQQHVRLPTLAAGVYVLQVATPAGCFTQRIIKP